MIKNKTMIQRTVSYIKLNNVIKLQCEWLILKYIKKSVIIRYLEYNYDS